MVNLKNGDLNEEVFIAIINVIENLLSIYFALNLTSRYFSRHRIYIIEAYCYNSNFAKANQAYHVSCR